MVYDGIVFDGNKYNVYVKYQDGTCDVGEFASLDLAKKAWVKSHEQWNGVKRNKNEVKIFEIKVVTETRVIRVK